MLLLSSRNSRETKCFRSSFFDIPVDNIYASPVLLADIERQNYDNLVIVSPDVGGVVRARAVAKQLDDADLAIIDKRRPKANESQVMHIIGEVRGRDCVIVDDMVDTAGTLTKAADMLMEQGAKSVRAYCTHGVLSGNAIERIEQSALQELVITDTIPQATTSEKIRVLSVANLFAAVMHKVNSNESISGHFLM